MKKVTLVIALSIAAAVVLAGCSTANQVEKPETKAVVETKADPDADTKTNTKTESQTGSDGEAEAAEDIAYPERPIELICPWAVGGAVDIFSRNVATVADKYLDQPIAVVNVTGAAGTLAVSQHLKEEADGYHLLVLATPVIAFQPHIREVSYTWDDFAPVIGMNEQRLFLLSNAKESGIETIDDLARIAKERKVTIGNGGVGGIDDVFPRMLFNELGIEVESVVFTSAIECQNALLGGHVDLAVGLLGNFEEQAKAGNLNILGTFSEEAEALADIGEIKSFKEQGYDAVGTNNYYIVAKAGTPQEIIDKLNKAFNEVYQDPEFVSYVEKMGMVMSPMSPEEVDAFMREKMDMATEILGK